ncbi:MAG: RdgB/HAM1 family non-canonical purine NTP pyrophosphatase [bacterium]|nr:RdgB/HAM1 family non-canonical purine NTP pyrophosphatase [bacterium]
MQKLFVATKNTHKAEEFRRILLPLGVDVVSESDLDFELPDVEETGTTFEENSMLKAIAGMKATGLPTVADDSGLCVDALGGRPGVYSARFAGEPSSDMANNDLLLSKLKDVPLHQRTARFVCCISCVFPEGHVLTAKGECEGVIGFEPKGENGFGYDCLFVSELGCFGELSASEKDSVSHRSKALKIFLGEFKKYVNREKKC